MENKQKCILRMASMEDATILFQWKNDKLTIENSISKRGVTMDEHVKWLKQVIENPNRYLYIFEVDGKPAGQLRLDIEKRESSSCKQKDEVLSAEISYGLGKEFRGRGLGKVILELAEKEAKKLKLSFLTAEVLIHNGASQRLFEKLNYEKNITDTIYTYRKDISKIYIRVDMNEIIATGHLMRCLSVADAAKKQGRETVFIIADEKPVESLKKRGYEYVLLNSDWHDMDGELRSLISVIRERGISKLLIDSYQVTESYLREVEKYTEVFYLDDLDAFDYPVRNVICYANYFGKLSYGNYKKETNFYLGTSYMPLREVYQNCKPKHIKERVERILVLSGGNDLYKILPQIADLFIHETGIELDIICGAFYNDFDGLKERYSLYPHFHFYQNVYNLDEFMEQADLAISAGGTTLYELCAKGTPTISYAFADNQLKNVKQFSEEKMIEYAGDFRYDDMPGNVYQLYKKYRNQELREVYSEKMQKVVDGKGASRIAALL